MIQMLRGFQNFAKEVFPKNKKLFEGLAQGQAPHTLLITCSDSRIDPNLVTQSKPGEIFVVRNVGNIVPPYGASRGGEEAAIEFATEVLGVRNIIVCGHSHCGAMAALVNPAYRKDRKLTAVEAWLGHAEATRRRIDQCDSIDAADMASVVQENVLVQADNLKTHPSVSSALRRGMLSIFGWVYHFESARLDVYDHALGRFIAAVEIGDFSPERIESLTL